MEIDPIKIAKSNDKQTAHIQFTIILVDPESSKSQKFIGSPLIKWIELIAEIYPPKPKKAACPNETKPPYPNTRLRPIPAIPKITIFVANVTKYGSSKIFPAMANNRTSETTNRLKKVSCIYDLPYKPVGLKINIKAINT